MKIELLPHALNRVLIMFFWLLQVVVAITDNHVGLFVVIQWIELFLILSDAGIYSSYFHTLLFSAVEDTSKFRI